MLHFQALPKNSSIFGSSFTAAILEVTQDVETFQDMKKNISLPVTIDKSEYKSDVKTRSLTINDFGGLFPVALILVALFFSLAIIKIPSIADLFHKKLVSVWIVSGLY